MSETPSAMIPLGTKAPDFTLPDPVTGKMVSLQNIKSDKATVVMIICNHCPYVKHVRHEFPKLVGEYQPKGVTFVAINPNDIKAYPEDSPDNMKKVAEELGFQFPYLFDESQDTARAYHAACTPDFYVFDKDMKLVYRGQMDGARPGNGVPVTGGDLRAALDNVLAGNPVTQDQHPSIGCSIKWK